MAELTEKQEKKAKMKEIKKTNALMYKKFNQEKKRKNIPESEYITTMRDTDNIIELDNLKTYFYTDAGTVKAVDGVKFNYSIFHLFFAHLWIMEFNRLTELISNSENRI